MSKERLKHTVIAPRTREEMEALVGEITTLKIQERTLKARLDAELTAVRESYEGHISDITEALAPKLARAHAWAEAHPEAFTGKSVEMLHGTIGWRLNTPSLKTLAGWTWDRVLEKLSAIAALAGYVRTKREVNKQALLADRDQIGADELRKIGVRVVQEEEFFVEPKITEADTRETLSA
jgi:phage host-nuclease inhibitor protein Gam